MSTKEEKQQTAWDAVSSEICTSLITGALAAGMAVGIFLEPNFYIMKELQGFGCLALTGTSVFGVLDVRDRLRLIRNSGPC